MSKTKETLSFYYKTQTKTTKGTRLTLDLKKILGLLPPLVVPFVVERKRECDLCEDFVK